MHSAARACLRSALSWACSLCAHRCCCCCCWHHHRRHCCCCCCCWRHRVRLHSKSRTLCIKQLCLRSSMQSLPACKRYFAWCKCKAVLHAISVILVSFMDLCIPSLPLNFRKFNRQINSLCSRRSARQHLMHMLADLVHWKVQCKTKSSSFTLRHAIQMGALAAQAPPQNSVLSCARSLCTHRCCCCCCCWHRRRRHCCCCCCCWRRRGCRCCCCCCCCWRGATVNCMQNQYHQPSAHSLQHTVSARL